MAQHQHPGLSTAAPSVHGWLWLLPSQFWFETSLLALSKKISEWRTSCISTTLSIPISSDKGLRWHLSANLISHYHSWDNNRCHTTTAICIIQKQRELFSPLSCRLWVGYLGRLSQVYRKNMLLCHTHQQKRITKPAISYSVISVEWLSRSKRER